MRVMTANIQNFPGNAPDEKYPAKEAEDMKTIHDLDPDVVLWQELAEKRDFEAVITEFGNTDYGTAAYDSECLVTWHRELLALQGHTQTVRVAGAAPGPFSPSRSICRAVFSVAGLPDVEVIDLHFTNGAYVGEKNKARYPFWGECWTNTQAYVKAAHDAGRIVIVGGDWNRVGKDIPLFHPSQKWVYGGQRGIDNLAVVTPQGWGVTVTKTINENINSDHNVRGADLVFERVLSKVEQNAVDALAKARTALGAIKSPSSETALAGVQAAINTLYGV